MDNKDFEMWINMHFAIKCNSETKCNQRMLFYTHLAFKRIGEYVLALVASAI